MTINDARGSISGTYLIQWGETPSEVSGAISDSLFLPEVLIEFSVQVEAGMAMCRYDATLRDGVVLVR